MTDQFQLVASGRVQTGAWLSDCGTYRYALSRRRMSSGAALAWVMLNPSTADASNDDPTIRKVCGFTERAGYGALWVVNLYAYRTTKPSALCDVIIKQGGEYAEGPSNRSAIISVAEMCSAVVCAWGATPWAYPQSKRVLGMLRSVGKPLLCIGTSKHKAPLHPLMPSYDGHPFRPFEAT